MREQDICQSILQNFALDVWNCEVSANMYVLILQLGLSPHRSTTIFPESSKLFESIWAEVNDNVNDSTNGSI